MTAPSSQRVVVTGCGALSPLGMTAADLVAGVAAGRSGIRRVPRAVQMGLPVTTARRGRRLAARRPPSASSR